MAASNEVLETITKRHGNDLGRAFGRLDKLDESTVEQRIKDARFESAMTEIGASLEGMKETIEGIAEKVDDIDTRVTVIQTELATMKAQPVNIVKILKFFSTTRGVILLIVGFGVMAWGRQWTLDALRIITGG